jgi:hypothetical protein
MRVVSRRALDMSLSVVGAECEEGGEANDGGCVGGAGAARDHGEDVYISTLVSGCGERWSAGYMSRVSCAVCERLVSVQYFYSPTLIFRVEE